MWENKGIEARKLASKDDLDWNSLKRLVRRIPNAELYDKNA